MRRHLVIVGIVQGVGFRPFVYRLATRHGLAGWVNNATDGVHIEVEGAQTALDAFIRSLQQEKPAQAEIYSLTACEIPDRGETGFIIAESDAPTAAVPFVSPDIATCEACRAEICDPSDRRYRYPFTNCTNCGPRYTIIRRTPYDRQMTTMDVFPMCEACQREFNDPANRRFHAQPNACPVCGPAYRLVDRQGNPLLLTDDPDIFNQTRALLRAGKIAAIKGLGGFHLACDAKNETAVATLRRRKIREDKPFAVMAGSLDAVWPICRVSPAEQELLTGSVRPILLLDKAEGYDLAVSVAPGNPRIGVMLPYTPLHELLLAEADIWVMTSGNTSDEPIAYTNEDALQRLGDIADFFLLHNRDIHRRADDSVVRIVDEKPYLLRRSRGYAPLPIRLEKPIVSVLACGGELKNTFCLTHRQQAFVSAHIGDLENLSTYQYYTDSIRFYKTLLNITPEVVAYDLHPEYLATKYAKELALPQIGVQHHHAHIASVMAESGLHEPVIGVAFDGTGYGPDGAIWGGEFMIADCLEFKRVAHCRYLPLPGGTMAIRQPWRVAATILAELYGDQIAALPLPFVRSLPPEWTIVLKAAEKRINTPLTSSAGRLFDAAAALLGIRGGSIHYEGQAAVELELAAGSRAGSLLPYSVCEGTVKQLDFLPTFAAMTKRLQAGESSADLAASFHDTVAAAIVDMVKRIKKETALRRVALSGGVFQNLRLLSTVERRLSDEQFAVYRHRRVPTNDGGLSLGQAIIAGERYIRNPRQPIGG
jgi:hydrogenase maturation protein HypF